MLEKRGFWKVLLLGLVTGGIYTYYWLYQTTKQINQMAGADGKTTNPATAVVLTIITCGIYMWYWYYSQGDRMQVIGRANNISIQESGGTYLLWLLLGSLLCGLGALVCLYLFIRNQGLLVDAYNGNSAVAG